MITIKLMATEGLLDIFKGFIKAYLLINGHAEMQGVTHFTAVLGKSQFWSFKLECWFLFHLHRVLVECDFLDWKKVALSEFHTKWIFTLCYFIQLVRTSHLVLSAKIRTRWIIGRTKWILRLFWTFALSEFVLTEDLVHLTAVFFKLVQC